jgi:hypothetical protein
LITETFSHQTYLNLILLYRRAKSVSAKTIGLNLILYSSGAFRKSSI